MQPQGIWGISRDFSRLSPCGGQVAYALLTRAPVAGRSVAAPPLPLDLHVLSLPLAFILSQDQTLRCCYMFFHFFCPAAAGARPPPDTGMEGAGAVPGRIDKGKPQKRGLPAFLAILFVSSHDVNVLTSPEKGEGTAKLARRKRPCNSRAVFFQAGPEKKRLPPFAVAKVLPATRSFQILSQLFLKKINPLYRISSQSTITQHFTQTHFRQRTMTANS